MNAIRQKKIGFIGVGNMTQAIIKGWIESQVVAKTEIFATNRSEGKLQKIIEQFGINGLKTNEELIETCDIVILAMKPQDFVTAIEPISSAFRAEQVVISLAAGINLKTLRKMIPDVLTLVRLMPNTPVRVGQAVIGYCTEGHPTKTKGLVEDLFSSLGLVVGVDEGEPFESLMVSCSSGVGFVLELMTYWQEWLEEHNFESSVAKEMTVKTFLGASTLATQAQGQSLEELQHKVASKKGVTAAGLDSMRELEIERALRYSFEKAVLRDREIAKGTQES